MIPGIIIDKSTNVNTNWLDGIAMSPAPLSYQVTGVTATAVSGGSLTEPKEFFYIVVGVGINGESIASTEVNATTTSSNKKINLSWSALTSYGTSYITEYRIYKGITSGVYQGYFPVSSATSFSDDGTKVLNTTQTAPNIYSQHSSGEDWSFIKRADHPTIAPVIENLRIYINEIYIDVSKVLNQPTWFTPSMTVTQQRAGFQQAVSDITDWITD